MLKELALLLLGFLIAFFFMGIIEDTGQPLESIKSKVQSAFPVDKISKQPTDQRSKPCDENGDGVIDASECQSDPQLMDADENGDGLIDPYEYSQYYHLNHSAYGTGI